MTGKAAQLPAAISNYSVSQQQWKAPVFHMYIYLKKPNLSFPDQEPIIISPGSRLHLLGPQDPVSQNENEHCRGRFVPAGCCRWVRVRRSSENLPEIFLPGRDQLVPGTFVRQSNDVLPCQTQRCRSGLSGAEESYAKCRKTRCSAPSPTWSWRYFGPVGKVGPVCSYTDFSEACYDDQWHIGSDRSNVQWFLNGILMKFDVNNSFQLIKRKEKLDCWILFDLNGTVLYCSASDRFLGL